MDPNLSNPKDPVTPTANVVVPPPVPESVVAQPPIQQPTTLPPVQPLPPIQNTPPPTIPQPSQSEPVAPPPDTNFDGLPKKHLISKKVAAIAVVLFLTVSIPLTVFVTNQQQNTETGAADQNPIVATFNVNGVSEKILKSDLQVVAEEQYLPDSITKEVLLIARDTYIERKILDLKTQELGLSITEDEINSLSSSTGLSQTEAKYELLKQRIIISQVNYVKAVSIGYWVPPLGEIDNYSTEDRQNVQKQKDEGTNAITQANSALNNGQDVLTVAQSVYANPSYSDLKSILSMNGNKFAQIPDADKQTAAEPALYEYGDTNFDSTTRDLLFGVAKGAVVRNQSDTSSGGASVFKITDKGSGTFDSYKVWLEQQKGNLYNPVNF